MCYLIVNMTSGGSGGEGGGEPSDGASFADAAGVVREEGAGPTVTVHPYYPYFLCSEPVRRVEPSSPMPSSSGPVGPQVRTTPPPLLWRLAFEP
jgi:hypothetical protein